MAHPATRGRPRDPGKREALVAAARRLFLRDGVDAVTLDQVLAEAGVSRATLYANFSDKGALLEAMIARESTRIVTDLWAQETLSGDVEQALIGFGAKLLAFLADPEMLGLERLIATAARSFPQLAARFYDVGPGRSKGILRRLIAAGQARGVIGAADPDVAAGDLLGLWQGFMRVELTFGQRPPPDADELHRRAAHGVAQFLRLYAPLPPGRTHADGAECANST